MVRRRNGHDELRDHHSDHGHSIERDGEVERYRGAGDLPAGKVRGVPHQDAPQVACMTQATHADFRPPEVDAPEAVHVRGAGGDLLLDLVGVASWKWSSSSSPVL